MRSGLALAVLAACDGRAPIASCSDDLRGVYAVDGRRWMVLDNRATLEAYPLFADGEPPGKLEVAPRVIDLQRTPDGLAGEVHRRYARGTARCDGTAAVHVTACAGDTLELVLADPQPPLALDITCAPPVGGAARPTGGGPCNPCSWSRPAPSRRERWTRD